MTSPAAGADCWAAGWLGVGRPARCAGCAHCGGQPTLPARAPCLAQVDPHHGGGPCVLQDAGTWGRTRRLRRLHRHHCGPCQHPREPLGEAPPALPHAAAARWQQGMPSCPFRAPFQRPAAWRYLAAGGVQGSVHWRSSSATFGAAGVLPPSVIRPCPCCPACSAVLLPPHPAHHPGAPQGGPHRGAVEQAALIHR